MTEELRSLISRYLYIEEGFTDLTDQELQENYESGLDVYGSITEFANALKQYIGV